MYSQTGHIHLKIKYTIPLSSTNFFPVSDQVDLNNPGDSFPSNNYTGSVGRRR